MISERIQSQKTTYFVIPIIGNARIDKSIEHEVI